MIVILTQFTIVEVNGLSLHWSVVAQIGNNLFFSHKLKILL